MTSAKAIAKPGPASPILSADEFGKRHDKSKIVPAKIKAGIQKLAEAKGWCYEKEFMALCGITSSNDFAAYRALFMDDFAVPVKTESRHETRAWCGTKELANKFRKQLGLVL